MEKNQQQTRLQQLLPHLFESKSPIGKSYLYFQLLPTQSAVLPIEVVEESLLVSSSHITPIPNMAPSVLGLMSSRSRVFVAVDLAQLLQLPASTVASQQKHVIVVRMPNPTDKTAADEPLLALVVNRVRGTLRVDPKKLNAPSSPSLPDLMPFVLGVVPKDDQQMPILDVNAIARLPALNTY